MNTKKPKVRLWSVLTALTAILTIAAIVGNMIANQYATTLNVALNASTYKIIKGDTTEDTEYFKAGFTSDEEREAYEAELCATVEAEGAALLKNDNAALPLAGSAKVSLFGHGSVDLMYGGTGSGSVDTSKAPNLKEALEAQGIQVNQTLWDLYKSDSMMKNYSRITPASISDTLEANTQYAVNEAPWSALSSAESSFAEYGDAAIVVFSRSGGEGADLPSGTNGTNDSWISGSEGSGNYLELSAEEQVKLLEKLDFKIENNEVVVPFFRTDINRMCDVAEEVARMYGYDKIPTTLYAGEMVQGEFTPSQQAERAAALVCREAGFDESMSHSFISPKFYDMIGWDENDPRRISTTILNPLGEDFSVMRTTVLPSMLDNLAHNHAHRNPTASLYELGTIYTPTVKDGKADPDVLPHEEKILTLGSYGRLSFFQFKGAIEALLRELNIKGASFAPEKANPSYHPGRCAKVLIDGKEIGVFGTIHPTVAARYGLSGEVLAAELQMDALLAAIDPEKLYHPLPKFPASTRDIAVLVDDAVPAASMQATVEKAAGKLLESVKLFDVYKGKGIPEGKKSVAYSLSLRAPDRTLTDEECDKAMRAAISALETEFGAQLRG